MQLLETQFHELLLEIACAFLLRDGRDEAAGPVGQQTVVQVVEVVVPPVAHESTQTVPSLNGVHDEFLQGGPGQHP